MAQPQESLPQHMLSHRCWQGWQDAGREPGLLPPPPRWQSPDGCCCPGTGSLRRVGRRWAGEAAGKSQPGGQLGEQMVRSAGEYRHLPARAGSQGNGAAPHRHPWTLLGQGGSQASGIAIPNLPFQDPGFFSPAWETACASRVQWSVAGCQSRAFSSVSGRSCLSSLLARKVFLEGHDIIGIKFTS